MNSFPFLSALKNFWSKMLTEEKGALQIVHNCIKKGQVDILQSHSQPNPEKHWTSYFSFQDYPNSLFYGISVQIPNCSDSFNRKKNTSFQNMNLSGQIMTVQLILLAVFLQAIFHLREKRKWSLHIKPRIYC